MGLKNLECQFETKPLYVFVVYVLELQNKLNITTYKRLKLLDRNDAVGEVIVINLSQVIV